MQFRSAGEVGAGVRGRWGKESTFSVGITAGV